MGLSSDEEEYSNEGPPICAAPACFLRCKAREGFERTRECDH